VNDDFAEGLRHGVNNGLKKRGNESRLQRWKLTVIQIPGALPEAKMMPRLWRQTDSLPEEAEKAEH